MNRTRKTLNMIRLFFCPFEMWLAWCCPFCCVFVLCTGNCDNCFNFVWIKCFKDLCKQWCDVNVCFPCCCRQMGIQHVCVFKTKTGMYTFDCDDVIGFKTRCDWTEGKVTNTNFHYTRKSWPSMWHRRVVNMVVLVMYCTILPSISSWSFHIKIPNSYVQGVLHILCFISLNVFFDAHVWTTL